jgi:hypothetical protein
MCIISLVFTPKELKALDKKSRDALFKRCRRMVQTSSAIRNIIKRDPKVCKKLRALMGSEYSRLRRKKVPGVTRRGSRRSTRAT